MPFNPARYYTDNSNFEGVIITWVQVNHELHLLRGPEHVAVLALPELIIVELEELMIEHFKQRSRQVLNA